MALFQFRLPDIGEGVAEAEITAWYVTVGDRIKEDQSLVDVMTDKATVDMTSPVDGVVTAIYGEVGVSVPVGSVLVELEIDDGMDNREPSQPALAQPEPVTSLSQPTPVPTPSAPPEFTPRDMTYGLLPAASPSTRRRAKRAGIDLRDIPASGPAGRITSHDLDAYLARPSTSRLAETTLEALSPEGGPGVESRSQRYIALEGSTETRIIGLRRKIAEKMQDAKRRIPHIAYIEEIDVTELEALRADLNAHKASDQPKLTLLPFLVRALVRSIPEFPHINSRYDDEAGILYSHAPVHVGIATQTPGGLMVPVIQHAETHDIWSLALELARLSTAARNGTARREELSGSTITITSLGTLGGIASTPVINHPEVAILGPNKIVDRPVVEGSFVTVRKMMNLSSSFDHRIVDGYDAAQFVQRLKRLIEHPALIFMD